MEIKKDSKEILVKNFEDMGQSYAHTIEDAIACIDNADTVEEIMSTKTELLLNLLKYFPTDGEYCYFCIESDGNGCGGCPYGEVHGICGEGEDDWSRIVKALRDLKAVVNEYYYSGEDYDETGGE